MFEVKYAILEKIRPLIDQAKDLEKTMHRTKQDEKAAGWMIQQAKEADLGIDEEVQLDLSSKLSKRAQERMSDIFTDDRLKDKEEPGMRKRETK